MTKRTNEEPKHLPKSMENLSQNPCPEKVEKTMENHSFLNPQNHKSSFFPGGNQLFQQNLLFQTKAENN